MSKILGHQMTMMTISLKKTTEQRRVSAFLRQCMVAKGTIKVTNDSPGRAGDNDNECLLEYVSFAKWQWVDSLELLLM